MKFQVISELLLFLYIFSFALLFLLSSLMYVLPFAFNTCSFFCLNCTFSFVLKRKKKIPKRKVQGCVSFPTLFHRFAKGQKLASLKQSALLNASLRAFASRKRAKAGRPYGQRDLCIRANDNLPLRHGGTAL